MKENKIPYPSQKIFSIDDARELAKWRLPKLVFDFVDGASGNEFLSINNNKAYENIKLEPRVLINVEERSLKTKFLDTEYGLPFGFAPMECAILLGLMQILCLQKKQLKIIFLFARLWRLQLV